MTRAAQPLVSAVVSTLSMSGDCCPQITVSDSSLAKSGWLVGFV